MGSRTHTPAANRFRPGLAGLEDRTAPAAHTWITNGAGLWSDPANWAGGVPQASNDEVSVTFAQPAVITVNAVDPGLVINQLNFNSGGTILNLAVGLSVGVENQFQTIGVNTAGNQINGTAALTLVGVNQEINAGAGDTLVINAPLAGAGGFDRTGAGLVQINAGALGGTVTALDGTTLLGGTVALGTLRVGDGDLNNGTPTLNVNTNANPDVDVLRVQADGTVNIGTGATLDADSVILGTANGGGVVNGPGTLDVGLTGLTVNTSATASRVNSAIQFSSPFAAMVDVPDGANGVDLFFSGRVQGSLGYTKTGAGTLRLDGAVANTLSDTTIVQDGTLEIGGAAGVAAVADQLVVEGLLDDDPVVRQLFNNVVADGASVTVGFRGTYDLNNRVESGQPVTVRSGGTYTLGNGVLNATSLTLANGRVLMSANGILIPPATVNVDTEGNSSTNQILGGSIDVTGGRTFDVDAGAVLFVTSALPNGTLTKVGDGEVNLAGVVFSAGAVTATDGTLTIPGLRSDTTVNVSAAGFLRGTGITDAVTLTGGSFQPGDDQGNQFRAPSLSASTGAVLVFAVFSPTAANRVDVDGPVSLGGADLTFISLADVPLGTAFTLINKTQPGAITGTLAEVPEGGTVLSNSATYRISYVGGDGNDLTATRVVGTTTALVPSVTSAPVGEAVAVVATVAAENNAVPTGTVVFRVDGVVVGQAELNGAGQAALVLPFLDVGNRLLTGEYLGTDQLGGSVTTQNAVVQVRSAASALADTFAAGAGDGGKVRVFNADATENSNLTPFGASGSVRTAVADFTGDGVPDVAVGAGPGSAPRIQVIDGVSKQVILDKLAFEAAFTGGVYLAAGDLTGDGKADLVITPDEGGGPRVTVLRGGDFAQTANFFAIDDQSFRGGARAAVGDINRDGRADLIVSAGFGGGPRVAGFDGRSLDGTPAKLFNDFFLFEQALRNGSFVTVGDVNGDGYGDLIGGGGPGGGPRVLALSGVDVIASKGDQSAVVANFFAGNEANRGGVRVSAKNLDGDVFADLVVGDGAGAGSRVTGYSGSALKSGSTTPAFAFDGFAGSVGGVFVG